MAFLDNSGDIILDAVLTDIGRERLARGDGSFKVSQFALADDEINYGLYDLLGDSAAADISIMKTPIIEALTDSAASMKSKLMTLVQDKYLYLPSLYLKQGDVEAAPYLGAGFPADGFVVSANADTDSFIENDNQATKVNYIQFADSGRKTILVYQGDHSGVNTEDLDADLLEKNFRLEMDSRFGKIVSDKSVDAPVDYIDTDYLATYSFPKLQNSAFYDSKPLVTSRGSLPYSGRIGNILKFSVKSTIDLQSSNYLFTKYGKTGQLASANDILYVKQYITVSGISSGATIDIPVYYIKKA
jgi:hypothetical protein